MKPKKDRVIKDVKAEYIKRMKSPAYVKQVKRTIELIENYNLYYGKNRLKRCEIRSIAHYFAEDIKNPITKPNQIIETKSDDVLTDSLLIS
jgi:hypothetical protein